MQEGINNRMDNQSSVRGFFSLYPTQNVFINALIYGYFFLVSAGGIPIRLFLRKNMGERAFSLLGFVTCIAFYLSYGILLTIMMSQSSEGISSTYQQIIGGIFEGGFFERLENLILMSFLLLINPLTIFLYLTFRFGVSHFKEVIAKARENLLEYSLYRGEGKYFDHKKGKRLLGYEIDNTLIRMVVEPTAVWKFLLPVLVFAWIVLISVDYDYSGQLGVLLEYLLVSSIVTLLSMSFSSLCVFLEELGMVMKVRNSVLDMIDGEVDMQLILKLKEEITNGQNIGILRNNIISIEEERLEDGNQKNIAIVND